MPDETYNGWTNRATWLVALHLNNTPESQDWALSTAAALVRHELGTVDASPILSDRVAEDDDPPARRFRLACSLASDDFRDYVRWELLRDVDGGADGFADGLLTALASDALASADWTRLVEAFAENAEELADA